MQREGEHMASKDEWTAEKGLELLDRCLNPIVEELCRIIQEQDVHAFNQLVTGLDHVVGMARTKMEEELAKQPEAVH